MNLKSLKKLLKQQENKSLIFKSLMFEMKFGLKSNIAKKKFILHWNPFSSYNILSVINYYYQQPIIYNQIINFNFT